MNRVHGILLLGPTGAGKTPLGEELERRGLWGRRCAHFDFGAQLREIAGMERPPAELSGEDVGVIRRSLETGALLEDSQFHIAAGILRAFARMRGIAGEELLVLNGMPRHEGQARGLEGIVEMEAVVSLECSAEVVYERIRLDSGGDRAGRIDDGVKAIGRKLELYAQRTRPLVEFYRGRGVGVRCVGVGVKTSAKDVWGELEALGRSARNNA